MALVFQKYRLTTTFIDTAGEKVKRSMVLTAPDEVNARSAAVGIMTAYSTVSNAKIAGYEITSIFVEDALSLPADADVKEVLVVNAPIAGRPNKRGWLSIPAPKDTMFYATSGNDANIANMTNPVLLVLIKVWASAANGGWGTGLLSDGETILLTDMAGERQHRKG